MLGNNHSILLSSTSHMTNIIQLSRLTTLSVSLKMLHEKSVQSAVMNNIIEFIYPQINIKNQNHDVHQKVCINSFESASEECCWFICSDLYIFNFLNNGAREKIMIFKTYDMQLHIQIIYCRLIGCCPAVQSAKPNWTQLSTVQYKETVPWWY